MKEDKIIETCWVVTSEGRKKTFYSEDDLNEYINKTRPANDSHFDVQKIVTEKCEYKVDSKFDKATIDKTLMIKLLHNLGKKILNGGSCEVWNCERVFRYTYLSIFGVKDQHELVMCLARHLMNATEEDIKDEFVFNSCDLKGCNNYLITYQNKAHRDMCGRYSNWGIDEVHDYQKQHDAIGFSIQFRPYGGDPDIVFTYMGDDCYGTRTHCVSTKTIPFTELEYKKLNDFINKIL